MPYFFSQCKSTHCNYYNNLANSHDFNHDLVSFYQDKTLLTVLKFCLFFFAQICLHFFLDSLCIFPLFLKVIYTLVTANINLYETLKLDTQFSYEQELKCQLNGGKSSQLTIFWWKIVYRD